MKIKLQKRYKTTTWYTAEIVKIKKVGEFFIVANIFDKFNNYHGIAHYNLLGKVKGVNEQFGDLIFSNY